MPGRQGAVIGPVGQVVGDEHLGARRTVGVAEADDHPPAVAVTEHRGVTEDDRFRTRGLGHDGALLPAQPGVVSREGGPHPAQLVVVTSGGCVEDDRVAVIVDRQSCPTSSRPRLAGRQGVGQLLPMD